MQIDVESVEFLNVPPDSVLIIRVSDYVGAEECRRIRDYLLVRQLPNITDVLIISGAASVSVMTAEASQ